MKPTKIYIGIITNHEAVVTIMAGGNESPLNPRLDLYSHSPTGFGWGYMGSGAAQLALAILADHYGKGYERLARTLYQGFKERVIAPLNGDEPFRLESSHVQSVCEELINERGIGVVDYLLVNGESQ